MKKILLCLSVLLTQSQAFAMSFNCGNLSIEIDKKTVTVTDTKKKDALKYNIDFSEFTDGTFYISKDPDFNPERYGVDSIYFTRIDTLRRIPFIKIPLNASEKVRYMYIAYDTGLDYSHVIETRDLVCRRMR